MNKLILTSMVTFLLLLGCKTTSESNHTRSLWLALADVKVISTMAEDEYGRLCAIGKVNAEEQIKIDRAIIQFQTTYKAVVRGVQTGAYSDRTIDDLMKLAQSLSDMIYVYSK